MNGSVDLARPPSRTTLAGAPPFGQALKSWRSRRGLSQLDLALSSDVSQRHVSFLEVGRAQPSRVMVLRLCEALNVPLRERNALLTAAGFAPVYSERTLEDAAMCDVRAAVDFLMAAHEPNLVQAIDAHWNILASNASMISLMAGALGERARAIFERPGPINAMRMIFDPQQLRPAIRNWEEVACHAVHRLRLERDWSGGDPVLCALYDELRPLAPEHEDFVGSAASPLLTVALDVRGQTMVFFTALTMLSTARDITLEGLRIETFFPADEATRAQLKSLTAKS